MSNVDTSSHQERRIISTMLTATLRAHLALAGSVSNERTEQGEEVQTSDMRAYEKVVKGKGQCVILSCSDLADDTSESSAPLIRRLFLLYPSLYIRGF